MVNPPFFRIEKHESICFKTGAKKRKAFDMTKARVSGTDAAAYVKNAAQLKAKPSPKVLAIPLFLTGLL